MDRQPPIIGCTAGTYDAQRQCARTGIGFEEPPPLPRVKLAPLFLVAVVVVAFACVAIRGPVDRSSYSPSPAVMEQHQ